MTCVPATLERLGIKPDDLRDRLKPADLKGLTTVQAMEKVARVIGDLRREAQQPGE